MTPSAMLRQTSERDRWALPRIAIIGAGLSGIVLAIELKKKLGLVDNVKIYERMSEPGGTWRDNTYPGCACDIPSHWYSLSTEPNPWWSSAYSPQAEILAYWKGIFDKHNLGRMTKFDHTFESAAWNADKRLYEIVFKTTVGHTVVEAEILISAIGGYSQPLSEPPSLPGLRDFKGEKFHSAKWDHAVDLRGKTIGVIGNGCSGAQFVPIIAQEGSSKILNFSRTPSWFYPRDQGLYRPVTKYMLAYVPMLHRIYRTLLATLLDGRFVAWPLLHASVRHIFESIAINHIRSTAPAKYHEFLIPTYPLGCKRVILDPGYLESLHRPNVELITDRIDRVTSRGILGVSGNEYPLDVLILATGFDLTARGLAINVTGRHGKSLVQQWDEQNGPQAYLGTAVSGFPNFYMILGPNTITGHASVIFSTESQVRYIIEMIRPIAVGQASTFEVKQDAEERYNRTLQQRNSRTVWSGCDSYYKLPNGKIIATFPGTLTEFWWKTRKPNFEHYLIKGSTTYISLALRDRVVWLFRLIAFVFALVSIRRHGIRRLGSRVSLFLLQRWHAVRRLTSGK